MRLLPVGILGAAALILSTTHFGSEAIRFDHWRNPSQTTGAAVSELPDLQFSAQAKHPAPETNDAPAAESAELRQPDGPPPPPPDIGMEALCHTLASAAQAHGIPTAFFARLIWQESKFQQRVVSSAGAQGVAQFMPTVAAARGLRNPFDALAALPHSARFLKEHIRTFGNLGLAAAAYNAGPGRVMRWLARRGGLPEETRNYVKIITGHPAEKWIQADEIELATDLPKRAPCDGVADLSHDAEPTKVAVNLEAPVARLIASARAAEATKLAAKTSKRQRLLAKGKGGKDKAQPETQVAGKSGKQQKLATRTRGKDAGIGDASAVKRKKHKKKR